MKVIGLTFALSAAAMAPTLAQVPAAQPTAIQFVSQQPADQWLARVFIGQTVTNMAGEVVGDVNDLVFDKGGQIKTVVLGVGGLLGMGEKNVGIPYASLAFKVGSKGERVIVAAVDKDALGRAPTFVAIEKTALDKVEDKAATIGKATMDKAVELKDRAAKKIDDMRTTEPAKK